MLMKVLELELKRRDLSYRDAAKEIGVTHTTIMRILHGDKANRDTLIKLSEWTGMSVSELLEMENAEGDVAIMHLLAGLVQREPKLKAAFEEAYQSLMNGEIDARDLSDIAAYIAFKLYLKKQE